MPVPPFGFWEILQFSLQFAAKNGILQLRKEFVKRMKKKQCRPGNFRFALLSSHDNIIE